MIFTTNESHRLSPAEASQFLLEMAGCVSRYLAERAVEPAAHSPSSAARIHDVLLHIGVPPHICGFRYLTEAVHQALLDSSCLERITFNLYPKVAQVYHVPSSSDGEFKSVDRALEYVRLKAGAPAVQTKQEVAKEPPARDEQGRFAKADNSEVAQYAQRLVDQAAAIHDATGMDVMALYNSDPDVKRKINSREWTFADVYKAAAKGSAESSRPAAPSPVRSSNGIALGGMNIAGMSAAQFDKLDDYLAKGGKINMT